MFRINVAGASLNQIPRDWEGNTERILEAITEAQKLGVSALCLPELAITGYSLEDEFFCPDVAIRAAKELKQIAAATVTKDANRRGMIAAVGLPRQPRNCPGNKMWKSPALGNLAFKPNELKGLIQIIERNGPGRNRFDGLDAFPAHPAGP